MNKTEALDVLRSELARWRQLPWSALRDQIERCPPNGWPKRRGYSETVEIRGASGAHYQVQIQLFWDDQPADVIRVLGAVDDGGLRAFVPVTDDFLMRPDGSFVGE